LKGGCAFLDTVDNTPARVFSDQWRTRISFWDGINFSGSYHLIIHRKRCLHKFYTLRLFYVHIYAKLHNFILSISLSLKCTPHTAVKFQFLKSHGCYLENRKIAIWHRMDLSSHLPSWTVTIKFHCSWDTYFTSLCQILWRSLILRCSLSWSVFIVRCKNTLKVTINMA